MKILRFLSLPLSFLYGLGVHFRNWMYDKGINKSVEFTVPTIIVGNLSVGGSGKTPMTEFLIEQFQDSHRMAVISRGYKRRSKGFILAEQGTSADKIGDEPFQLFSKYPKIKVAVGEQRAIAVVELMSLFPDTELIVFDDAFQHRIIEADCKILLSPVYNPFYDDHFLPTGKLRDSKAQSKRADIIIFTKAENPNESTKAKLTRNWQPERHQQVFVSGLSYGEIYNVFTKEPLQADQNNKAFLITGIANNRDLVKYLESKFAKVISINFPDHFYFTEKDIKVILDKWHKLPPNTFFVTTEKDATRLMKYRSKFEAAGIAVYAQPVRTVFNPEDEAKLTKAILQLLEEKKRER